MSAQKDILITMLKALFQIGDADPAKQTSICAQPKSIVHKEIEASERLRKLTICEIRMRASIRQGGAFCWRSITQREIRRRHREHPDQRGGTAQEMPRETAKL
jgi:hypothetical protein